MSDTTKPWFTRLAQLTLAAAANLFPGYFAVVMATGATSIALNLLDYRVLALFLLLANCLAYGFLWFLTVIRVLWYPKSLVEDMVSHARGPGFFTLIAGTCILGSQFQLLFGWNQIAAAFWWVGVILWAVIMYLFFIAVTTRKKKPALDSGINGAWLLAAVSTQSVSILTALVPWSGPEDLRLFFALCMFMIGCMLYLAIITMIFYRLTFLKLNPETLSPPYWINMGAVAITTLAGSTLILRGQEGSLLVDFLPFMRGFTLFFWSIASWWIPLLIGLSFWRHFIQRHKLKYEPQLWSLVFPLAMYTTGTIRLADALNTPFLMTIPVFTVWLALAAWVMTSFGMWRHLARLAKATRNT
ncbi:putative membrane protein [Pseudidiomarina piscicola]|uniref:Putative membrane protein n=1 Tax=Pseudidiomarina piscicola TaxID=2614830 RepID=A0A6S6WLY9_9GAMM|nr:tellurite resistance/C4-dicarboxylate transporter family protein [Pseudidiomarina piscicola]CAB0150299.1 putative membrane protein [Pseudidiomarina piscicola]VZT39729.1 putative membrane protein [Pseudomonas aeruginosa]